MQIKPTSTLRIAVTCAVLALFFGKTQVGWSRLVGSSAQFNGQASAISFMNLHTGPSTIVIANTGVLNIGGGSIDVSVMATNMERLSLELANASTRGTDNQTVSESSVQNLMLIFMTASGVQHTLTVELITAQASATCGAAGLELAADSEIRGLTLDNVAINVTGEINQTLVFDEFTLVLNEQMEGTVKGGGTVSVAAIHILVHDCLHGTIGFARAGIRCPKGRPPTTTECHDWLTGGGWIVGTPTGDRGNFGVGGGIRRGFWGHLNYIDHGTGMHVKATAVTGYEEDGPYTRIIHYNVAIDGHPATAVVRVTDNGEPGRDDTFEIQLSTGYSAGGSLGGDGEGGGNIQLHKSKCRQ